MFAHENKIAQTSTGALTVNATEGRAFFQPKLTVNEPGDKYEQEADSMADKVMRMQIPASQSFFSPSATIQRKCKHCEDEGKMLHRKEDNSNSSFHAFTPVQRKCKHCEDDDKMLHRKEDNSSSSGHFSAQVQRKCKHCEDEGNMLLHRKEQGKEEKKKKKQNKKGTGIDKYVNSLGSSGQHLSTASRKFFEPRFGHDFSNVKIHHNAEAAKSAQAINALAYTTGNHIVFNHGQYAPGSDTGKRLLAHELTHVVQQGMGKSLNIQRSEPSILDEVADTAKNIGNEVVEKGEEVVDAVKDKANEAVDWLETQAGQLAKKLAGSLGGLPRLTTGGIVIDVPEICPVNNLSFAFNLPSIEKSFMIPVFALPIGPNAAITGEIGLTGGVKPGMQLSLGPLCIKNVHVVINPLTSTYSVSGSLTAAAAAALQSVITAGIKGEVSLNAIIPAGSVPIPVKIPIGLEGGLAGMGRAAGASQFTMNGQLSSSSGVISMDSTNNLKIGLAADFFAGAYAQMNAFGLNLCRIYWQPWQWHGDLGASIGMSAHVEITPGLSPSIKASAKPPTIDKIPFNEITKQINRKGFVDCELKDYICAVLRKLKVFPSQNGGKWDPHGTGHGGKYGPGKLLGGPLEVYETNPGIASGSHCRGACGANCDTCKHQKTKIATDKSGVTWEYYDFEDCNSNDGCRQHDAAFDWAADKHGETGPYAMILPWHMAGNAECACSHLFGNCIAWIAGLPPYDRKMFFATSVKKVGAHVLPPVKPTPVLPPVGPQPVTPPPAPVTPTTVNVPTGLTEKDPIPIVWYKPIPEYPDTIMLNNRPYRMSKVTTLPKGEPIGVEKAYYPFKGKKMQLLFIKDRGKDTNPTEKKFIDVLARYGFNWANFSPDHVQDLMWSGDDDYPNLWPLDRVYNRDAGKKQNQDQRITFRPSYTSQPVVNVTIQTARQQHNMVGRFFKIDTIASV